MRKPRPKPNAALIQKEQWGVPIWNSNNGYPNKTDSPDKWKWEFLRRTDEFRNDWEKAQDKKLIARKYRLSEPVPPNKRFPEKARFNKLPEAPTGGVVVYPRIAIPDLNQPKKKSTKNLKTTLEDLLKYADIKPTAPFDWYEMRVWVEYDLGYALDPQLVRAEDSLGKLQNQLRTFMGQLSALVDADDYGSLPVGIKKQRGANKKNDFREMEKLLRIIDAKRSNVNNRKIVLGLCDLGFEHMDDSSVSKSYKMALKLWKEL